MRLVPILVLDQRVGDQHPLLLAAGELADARVGERASHRRISRVFGWRQPPHELAVTEVTR
jgi:hypothetical protein